MVNDYEGIMQDFSSSSFFCLEESILHCPGVGADDVMMAPKFI